MGRGEVPFFFSTVVPNCLLFPLSRIQSKLHRVSAVSGPKLLPLGNVKEVFKRNLTTNTIPKRGKEGKGGFPIRIQFSHPSPPPQGQYLVSVSIAVSFNSPFQENPLPQCLRSDHRRASVECLELQDRRQQGKKRERDKHSFAEPLQ